MSSWHSYPKVYNMGHAAITGTTSLTDDPVLVEEKVDGSQFSFGVHDGKLMTRSKGRVFEPSAAEDMFKRAVESIQGRQELLREGWTYRGEYLRKPKHNSLAYDRVPEGHIMIFDVETAESKFLGYEEKAAEAERIGLEVVPCIFEGMVTSAEQTHGFLERESVLGGQKIEGVVLKNYERFTRDGKVMMAKHVSEAFKEVHKKEWKKSNPTAKDIVGLIADQYRTPARWAKGVQHLEERGELTGTPRDIGALFKEVPSDMREECEDEIKEQLFKWAWPHISRIVTRGMAEWYKGQLVEAQFGGASDSASSAPPNNNQREK